MAFKKGKSGNPKGRRAGSQNKTTRAFKEAVLNVFDKNGGEKWLAKWAKKEPTEFFRIASRMIPHEHTGSGGAPLIPSEEPSFFETARRLAFVLHMGALELEKSEGKGSRPSQDS